MRAESRLITVKQVRLQSIKISSHPNQQPPNSPPTLIATKLKYLSKFLSHIFKIAPSKIAPSKAQFSKMLSQESLSLYLVLIYSLSNSLEELCKSSIKCLITFFSFSMYLQSLKALADNTLHLF